MKRVVFSVLLVAVLASAVYASCKVGELGWSYSINNSRPKVFNLAVKGAVQNTGKTTISSVIVKVDVCRKSDNAKVASMSATLENIAPGVKANFKAGPAMVVPSGTDVNATYKYKIQSTTER